MLLRRCKLRLELGGGRLLLPLLLWVVIYGYTTPLMEIPAHAKVQSSFIVPLAYYLSIG